jgi:hypothetical protein
MSEAKYSQPLPETPRDVAGPVLRAGFVHGRPGFIFSQNGKEKRVAATRANVANEQPRGFFQSLARIFSGGPHA